MRSRLLPHRAYRAVADVVRGGRAVRAAVSFFDGVRLVGGCHTAPVSEARRLVVAVLVSLFVPVCVFAAVAPAAGATQVGSGVLYGETGVAVDAVGDLYVADTGNVRVDKFAASGSFLLAWGWGVAGDPGVLQTCTTTCRRGEERVGTPVSVAVDGDPLSSSYGDVYVGDVGGAGGSVEKYGPLGEFLLSFAGVGSSTNAIAVGPGGLVYVGGEAQVQVFEPSGVLKETISLSALSSTAPVASLTVDSVGDVFVAVAGVPGVHEFEPGGAEKVIQFDVGSTSVDGVALDGSGHLFVSDSSGGFQVLEYDAASGEEVAVFAQNAVSGGSRGLAFSQTTGDLYASVEGNPGPDYVQVLGPPPGPSVEGEVATPEPRGVASLEARVDPEGAETTYSFEYVDEARFQASGFVGATGTTPVSIPASFEAQGVVAHLTGLLSGVTYHWRVMAHNSKGTFTGSGQTFEETPAALVSGSWAADVASTSATLAAQINPLGASTEYRLEYGASLSYGQAVSGSLGEGMSSVPISRHLQGLLPGTVYHYRFVTHSTVGTVEGADHTFTTQPVGGELSLPDGRAWELVSPPNKKSALIEPLETGGTIQAASDGNAITYVSTEIVGEGPVGKDGFSQALSVRGAGGWGTQALTIPHRIPTEESAVKLADGRKEYAFFSPDLSLAVVSPQEASTPLSPEATGRTMYVRDNAKGSFVPMVYPGNIPAGAQFENPNAGETGEEMRFKGATPDLSHVLLGTSFALTPEAISCQKSFIQLCGQNLYEWSAGLLQLVNILPNGQATPGEAALGRFDAFRSSANAVSSDGRWVVWDDDYAELVNNIPVRILYVRDMVGERTVQIGRASAVFEGMSSDGSRIFFLEGGDLYEFDTGSDTSVDLTAHLAGEVSAGVELGQILDEVRVSEDGSYVYLVATGVLANGGVSGANNLYVLHDEGGVWSTRYVGALSDEDEQLNYSELSPNGRFLAFMSNGSLTGYDNLDVNSGQPDEEVFLYDGASGRLVCSSCNPSGSRPTGVQDIAFAGLLADTNGEWSGHWLAGSLADPEYYEYVLVHQPRSVSDSGRLFFNSSDALVPQDTNGLMDVYQYEPVGVGDCVSGERTFSERSGGCVDLISPGTSSGESVFMDASENGNDAFFVTSSRLTAADYDSAYDVYDAHVCSAAVPCVAVPVSPPACTTADSCKAAPSPQPEIFGPAPSATFSGIGNVVEEAKKGTVKRKVKPKHHPKKKKKRKGRKAKRSRAGGAKGSRAGGSSVKGGGRSS